MFFLFRQPPPFFKQGLSGLSNKFFAFVFRCQVSGVREQTLKPEH